MGISCGGRVSARPLCPRCLLLFINLSPCVSITRPSASYLHHLSGTVWLNLAHLLTALPVLLILISSISLTSLPHVDPVDLWVYSPATNAWTSLSPTGPAPSERILMGFTATPDGRVYLFGGAEASEYLILSTFMSCIIELTELINYVCVQDAGLLLFLKTNIYVEYTICISTIYIYI